MKSKQDIKNRITKLEADVVKKPATKFQDVNNDQPNDSSILKNPAEVQEPEKKEDLTDTDKDAIVAQAIQEIQFARKYKQGKVSNWQKNEEMYYAKKRHLVEARSNVDLGRMQEHVHTVMSQIDDGLTFKFSKRKESQLKRANRLNSLRSWDSQRDMWDLKDIVGKKQCTIYGRAAYVYYANSIGGIYTPHLENIDIYDLLVDPSGGGIDVEQMLFWGRYGVLKSKEELQAQLEKTTSEYEKRALTDIIAGSGNNTESSQEETNKTVRMYGQNTVGKKDLQTDEKYKFWQWFTTYKGTRYVLTLQSIAGKAIEISPFQDKFASNLWPLWTYAAFMDLTEFWTPSYCDYVREIFMNQNVTINQMNDNAEAVSKPQKVVNVSAIENLAELKYRRDGLIKTKGEFDANKAVQLLQVPSITTPLLVYDKLEAIVEKSSGVTAGDKGAENTEGKVAIYKGNKIATAGRYGLFNKSYSFGYDRFANLYQWGVREHLLKKVSIDILGPDGVETEEVSRRDIFRKGDDFRVMVESSNADKNSDIEAKTVKIQFLNDEIAIEANNPVKTLNQKKAFEIKAKIAGFNEDEIKELMDVSEFGNQELMSEAARDIESILDGEKIKPNQNANNAYKQRFVDYMKDHQEDLNDKQWSMIVAYVKSLDSVIYANEARALLNYKTKMLNMQSDAEAVKPLDPGTGGEGQGLNNNSGQQ